VRIGPCAVVDASTGPIILDSGAEIEPFTRLSGPAYVGRSTQLLGGKVMGPCAFGPGCKISGEIEASIVQGFSNKAHDGYFGHGFLGEWVNLGAMTTNSDLKNTYGTVRVLRSGETVDTGCIKVGSYLSDHTKAGIGTLLPTGACLGVGVNIVAGGLTAKSIPPFVWGGAGDYMEHRLERMLETTKIVVERRAELRRLVGLAERMSSAETAALRVCFEQSEASRRAFLSAAKGLDHGE
jgi:UDP-N-acetylglucosamine diphosphorylase/glucosamine-1-phosphate N-acetyltransferase